MREWYRRKTPEERRAWATAKDAEQRRATARRWRQGEEAKRRKAARDRVYRAVKNGSLVRGVCEQRGDECRGDIHAHHDDYSKPLDVRWLCQAHHVLEEAAF